MKTKRLHDISRIAFVLCGLTISSRADEPRQTDESDPVQQPAVIRVALKSIRPTFHAKIARVSAEGTVEILQTEDIWQPAAELRAELTEGYYLAVAQASCARVEAGARFLRAVVIDVRENGAARLQIGKDAAKAIKPGEYLTLCRPAGSTTSHLKQLPDMAPLVNGECLWPLSEAEYQAYRNATLGSLRMIGLAFHQYWAQHTRFPPAFVSGPDGKPWHSWRVLLLPYLNQQQLYDRYKWDEPWDGPNNIQLLKEMPRVYMDPIYGRNSEFLAHFTAVTGPGTAFPTSGSRFDGKELDPKKLSGIRLADVTDGTSSTLIVGPVGPERKIPWMKPEDVVIEEKTSLPGAPGGFAFSYPTQKGLAGPFLFADGFVCMIPRRTDPGSFAAALTIAGRDVIDPGELSGADLSNVDPSPVLIISAVEDPKLPTARIVLPAQK